MHSHGYLVCGFFVGKVLLFRDARHANGFVAAFKEEGPGVRKGTDKRDARNRESQALPFSGIVPL